MFLDFLVLLELLDLFKFSLFLDNFISLNHEMLIFFYLLFANLLLPLLLFQIGQHFGLDQFPFDLLLLQLFYVFLLTMVIAAIPS